MLSPALIVAVPLAVAATIAAVRDLLPRWITDLVAILTAFFNFVVAGLWTLHALDRTEVYWFGNWFPRGHMAIGIGFVMDGVGCGLAALASMLTFLALVFSWKHVESGERHYHPLMLVFLGAMCGFSVTGDIFNLFVFFELMSTAAFALCGLKTKEPAPLAGAFNFAVTNTVAAFMVLTGIALLYSTTGALNLAQIGLLLTGRHDRLVMAALVFITTGFLVKAATVPFHFWLPDAHAVSPTPVCVLFSGLMVQLGLFGAMRVYATIFQGCLGDSPVHWTFVVFGGFSALWGGMMCFAEHHLKRLLAFSTVSHTGLMVLAFGLWSKDALTGLFVYLTGHALVKSGLFFVAGVMLHRLRTISEPAMFGRGRSLKWTALLWFLGGLGLAAAPGFALEPGEAMVTSHAEWAEWIFIAAGVLTGAAVLRVGFRVFLGMGDAGPTDKSAQVDEKPETEGDRRIKWTLFTPGMLCIGGAIALTFWTKYRDAVWSSSMRFMDFRSYAQAVYAHAMPVAMIAAPHEDEKVALALASLRAALAVSIALWTVLHLRMPRALRWPSHLEGSMQPIRKLQSGHPGDYVAWLTFGVAVFGAAAFWLGR